VLAESTGMLHLLGQVQRQRRSEAITLFPFVPPKMCGSMAKNHIMLPPL